jgi:glucose-1-phosphate cytidylyltransferase
MSMPKVVILCGGMGTRLLEETAYRPKPLVEIGGRAVLWHIMKIYAHHGFKSFVLCLGYKGSMIKQYFLDYQIAHNDFTLRLDAPADLQMHSRDAALDWSITFAETGADAMTGARVKRIEKYIDGDDFMLTYGDGVADINVADLYRFHRAHGRLATVTGVRPLSRYGELAVTGDMVTRFSEKPQAQDGLISGGFFVLGRRIFDYLHDSDDCVLEREPLERVAADGELMTYHHPGYWHCMDTYRDFIALNESWKKGGPWKVWPD